MGSSSLDQLKIERKAEPPHGRRRWLVPLLIASVVAAVLGWWYLSSLDRPLQVRTAVVREFGGASGGTVLNASGYVTARRQATVSSKFTGRVTEVLIEEGMQVEEGQIMARLDDSNLQPALALAEAQGLSAQRNAAETEAHLTEARLNFERTEQLVERQLASEAEHDRARALVRSLEAQLERKQADVQVAERQADIYRQQIEDSIIRAPFAGVVVAKNAQPGEMISPVSAGGGFTRTGIGTVVDMDSLEVEVDVNEAYIKRVSPGQAVVATLDAYPDWKIPCHVIAIIPTADRQRATVEVRVGFDALDSRILPDMGVKVAFRDSSDAGGGETTAAGLRVPSKAVVREGGRDYVFVVAAGRAERRAVSLGSADNGSVHIVAGLASGESVVVDPPVNLADGVSVRESEE
ncbi:MAG: efflux RND transporter periplasmic adaptor subunit [Lysobacterales bacterium]